MSDERSGTGTTPEPATDQLGREGIGRRFIRELQGGDWLVTVLAVVLALAIAGVLIIVSDPRVQEPAGYFFSRPGDTLSAAWNSVSDAYAALFSGSIIDFSEYSVGRALRPFANTLERATPLIAAGLAFAVAFRAGLFNIGVEGQIMLGATFAAFVGFTFDLPVVLHVTVAVIAGLIGGALWAGIPGVLKATTGAHEVIVTIMLNNIGLLLLGWMLTTEFVRTPGRSDPISRALLSSAQLPGLPGFRLHSGLFVALAAAVVSWWLIERSTYGFEVKAVGHNARAAQFAGMRPARVHWSILLIGGAMAGLGGIVLISGVAPHRLTGGFSAGLGFDGITVALLGRSSPAGIVAAAILFGALEAGGLRMQVATQTSLDLVTVVQAMVVLFIAAPPLIRSLYRVRAERPAELEASTGWSA